MEQMCDVWNVKDRYGEKEVDFIFEEMDWNIQVFTHETINANMNTYTHAHKRTHSSKQVCVCSWSMKRLSKAFPPRRSAEIVVWQLTEGIEADSRAEKTARTT